MFLMAQNSKSRQISLRDVLPSPPRRHRRADNWTHLYAVSRLLLIRIDLVGRTQQSVECTAGRALKNYSSAFTTLPPFKYTITVHRYPVISHATAAVYLRTPAAVQRSAVFCTCKIKHSPHLSTKRTMDSISVTLRANITHSFCAECISINDHSHNYYTATEI